MSVLGSPVLCAEHIAFPLGKVARCGVARTVTDEVRPPAAGVTAVRTFANPVLCAEHIAFPLGKVARCGAARTVTDEVRPPAAGVTAAQCRLRQRSANLGSPYS